MLFVLSRCCPVLDLTGSATLFGAVLAASMLPTVLLSPDGKVLMKKYWEDGLD